MPNETQTTETLETQRQMIWAAMEEWSEDESTPDDMSFAEWAKMKRPDLVPLLDRLPPSNRPMPNIGAQDDEE